MSLEHAAAGALLTVLALGYLHDRFAEPDADQFDSLEQLQDAFADGDISWSFFEAHATAYADERAVQWHRELQRVQGVGPAMAVAIARHYPVRGALENATAEEIADAVHGVGPSLARELKSIYE